MQKSKYFIEALLYQQTSNIAIIGAIIFVIIGLLYTQLTKPVQRIRYQNDVGWVGDGKRVRRTKNAKNWPPVYPNTWYALALSEEVQKGQVIYIPAIGENFAVFRSEKGDAMVLDAYCPHLGANMAVGGKVHGDCIECPFHNWQFHGSTGECTLIPNVVKPPAMAKVKSWLCHETNGSIFVWYHAEGEEPHWYPPSMDEVNNGHYYCFGTETHYISTHIQDIPENLSDLAHFHVVHQPSTLAGEDLRNTNNKLASTIIDHDICSTWEVNQKPEEKHMTTGQVSHTTKFFGFKIMDFNLEFHQIGPTLTNTHLENLIVFSTVTPQEPLLQKFVIKAYIKKKSILCPIYFHFISEMVSRDAMIWNNKCYKEHPIYTKDDKNTIHFRKWMSQFYSKNSISYEKAKERLDW